MVNAIGLGGADAFTYPSMAVYAMSINCLLKLSSHCHIVVHRLWPCESESRNGITKKGIDMAEYPSRDRIGNALLTLIYLTGGDQHQLRASDTYEQLADSLHIGHAERHLLQDEYYANGSTALVWPNVVQLARWDLVDAGLVDGSEYGMWRLTSRGVAAAQALVEVRDQVAEIMKRLKTNDGERRLPKI
jgi:hypothetical protein